MALVAFVLIVDRAGTTACNRSDRGAGSAACDSADGSATGSADSYSLDGSASPMPAMIPVINHISSCRAAS